VRALITGAGGFAGGHLAAHCRASGDVVVEASRRSGTDLRDAVAARAAVEDARPDVVYHLAGRAHVGESWEDPAGFLRDNVGMALNVLEAVRVAAPLATVVAVSSGELYGAPVALPVDEEAPLRPQNPYAVSKTSADLLAGLYADAHGLHVIRPRAFNHAGPGQGAKWAIASFTRQAAEAAERGDDPIAFRTGNPDTRRDYTDVRDVARAYRLLAERAEPGVYNVCTGRSTSAGELLAMLAAAAGAGLDHHVDPELVRANEVMEVRGDPGRLRAATGWEPQIPLERTLADTVAWWREELRAGRG
jgi:GDP-4-dehydro-6-deoxy-D-mannose reductase